MRVFVFRILVFSLSCRNSGTATAGLHRRLLDHSVGGVLANNNNNNNQSSNPINHLLATNNNNAPGGSAAAAASSSSSSASYSTLLSSTANYHHQQTDNLTVNATPASIDANQCVNEVLMTLDSKLLGRLIGGDEQQQTNPGIVLTTTNTVTSGTGGGGTAVGQGQQKRPGGLTTYIIISISLLALHPVTIPLSYYCIACLYFVHQLFINKLSQHSFRFWFRVEIEMDELIKVRQGRFNGFTNWRFIFINLDRFCDLSN